jgi:Spy/CpxP family protein refolding chaperone
MSFKHKFISAITLALAIGTFTTFVSAQDNSANNQQDSTKKERKFERRGEGFRGDKGMHGGKHGGDRMLMGAIHRLDLTDAQKSQIKTILETNKPNQTQFSEMRGLMQKKRDGSITEQEQARLEEIRTQAKASAEQTHNSILAVLTAEQRTQLEQMKQEMRERRGNRKAMKRDGQTPNKTDDN